MYYSDKPIEKISEDKLDRKGFAKTIATTLFDLKQADTFTVGLLGKWGVGKTSLVNLILSEFKAIDERNNGYRIRNLLTSAKLDIFKNLTRCLMAMKKTACKTGA